MTQAQDNIHGTGLVLGAVGIVILGPSGAGKSLLALDLLEHAALSGTRAALVADDRLDVSARAGRVTMAAPAAIAGQIEVWGRGVVPTAHIESAPVDLVVELVAGAERMPPANAFETTLAGVVLARCPVPQRGLVDGTHQRLLVHAALKTLRDADPA